MSTNMKWLVAVSVLSLAVCPMDEDATCSTSNAWPVVSGTGANVSSSTNINGWMFLPVNSTLYAFNALSGASLGSVALTGTIEGQPAVVKLSSTLNLDAHWYIFVTTQAG